MPGSTSLYAAIDLGSNSFHMLVIREVAGSIQTIARIKRKVRLAAGLNADNVLSAEAMARGWQCLRLFAERLRTIPATQIRAVATATLRLATNADTFILQAEEILGCPIQVICGEEEARLIYQGVAHTTGGVDNRLVVDIGGASTELVTGCGTQTTALFSLPMGCVTWLERFFTDRNLSLANFTAAETAATMELSAISDKLKYHGWQICVGASGTIQALQEIMIAQGMDEKITLAKLLQLKLRTIQCSRLDELEIEGLTPERAIVFPGGLSILISIFKQLGIDYMTLAGGALREGLVYDMLPPTIDKAVRSRTIRNIQRRFGIDCRQAQRVKQLAQRFADNVNHQWALDDFSKEMLISSALLHEIGLSVDFKSAPQHASYLINHLDLPGFSPSQKKLLATLLLNQTNPINIASLHQQNAVIPQIAERLCRLLRLAIIFSGHRQENKSTLPLLSAEDERLFLTLPTGWLTHYPLSAELLEQESLWQNEVHWPLTLLSFGH